MHVTRRDPFFLSSNHPAESFLVMTAFSMILPKTWSPTLTRESWLGSQTDHGPTTAPNPARRTSAATSPMPALISMIVSATTSKIHAASMATITVSLDPSIPPLIWISATSFLSPMPAAVSPWTEENWSSDQCQQWHRSALPWWHWFWLDWQRCKSIVDSESRENLEQASN